MSLPAKITQDLHFLPSWVRMARKLKPDQKLLRSCGSQTRQFHLWFPFPDTARGLRLAGGHAEANRGVPGLRDKGASLPFTQLQTLILPPPQALRGPEPEALPGRVDSG